MADFDPDALERELQRDLETIRKYKELMARRAAMPQTPPAPVPASTARPVERAVESHHGRPTPAGRGRGGSLIQLTESVLLEDWQPVRVYVRRAQSISPRASRAAVATALRRLETYGRAEMRRSAENSLEYRKAPKNDAP